MKKITFVFACALALASCSKEMSEPVSGNSASKITITATISDDFKTVLGDKSGGSYPVIWNAGDCLTLNGVKSSPLAEGGSKSAQFTFEGEFTAPYNLLYGGKEGTADVVSFKSVQTYVENTFDAESAPMYGSSNEGYSVKLSPLNSILQFNVKSANADVISSVSLKANGGEIISGDFRVGSTSGLLDGSLTPVSGGTSVVSLDLGTEGVTLQDGIDTKFYLAIPSGYYTEGFTVDFITASGETMELRFWSVEGKDVPAGVVYEFASTEFESNTTKFVIATPADLVTFANNYGGKEKVGTQAVVIADIEMGGETPYSPYKNECGNTANFQYYGTLDGGGHTISGLTTPLFNELYGYVKNLKVVSNIEYDDTKGQTYGIGVLAHYAKTDTAVEGIVSKVENVTTSGSVFFAPAADLGHAMLIGGILGSSNGVPVENCLNEATVTVDESTAFTAAATSDAKTDWLLGIGGIAGACQSNANSDITGCTNDGDIICNAGGVKSFIVMGGITGRVTSKASLTDCTNNGNLSIDNASHSNSSETSSGQNSLGGIFGYTNAGGGSIIDCNNNGTISKLAEDAKRSNYIGGIMGYINNCDFTISGCTNASTATITSDKKSVSYNNLGGIVGYTKGADKVVTIKSCTNNAAISANNSTNSYLGESGIVGFLSSGATITDCHNTGAITRNSGCTGNYEYIGGIIASIPQSITAAIKVSDCTNSGSFTIIGKNKSPNSDRCGGIVGSVASAATFTNCDNSGVLTNSTGSTDLRLGGIVGSTSSKASTFTDCDNTGAVSCTKATTSADLGGICGYNGQACTFKNCTNSAAVTSSADVDSQRVGGIIGNSANKAKLNSCSSTGNLATYGNDQTLCGAITGYSTSASTVTTCSVSAIDVCGTTLTASNYGSYLKGTGSTADTNLTTTNVSFIGEEASNSGTNENFGGFSDITLE